MVRALAAALLLMLANAMPVAADPILGWWRTPTEDRTYGHVEVQPCANAYCGTLRRGFDDQDREGTTPLLGREILTGVQVSSDGTYTGRAYRPKDNKTYNVTLKLDGNRLEIKGCAVGGLICSTSIWTRVP